MVVKELSAIKHLARPLQVICGCMRPDLVGFRAIRLWEGQWANPWDCTDQIESIVINLMACFMVLFALSVPLQINASSCASKRTPYTVSTTDNAFKQPYN